MPTNKASTAFYSSVPHTISAKPEVLSVTPTSSANSEHTTVFQTAAESVYTLSASPKPTNPPGMSCYTNENVVAYIGEQSLPLST